VINLVFCCCLESYIYRAFIVLNAVCLQLLVNVTGALRYQVRFEYNKTSELPFNTKMTTDATVPRESFNLILTKAWDRMHEEVRLVVFMPLTLCDLKRIYKE
jgi:hypothetical protein